VDWRISKKLLPGSIVVLSPDKKFDTLFVALVKNHDPLIKNQTHKKFGYVSINLEIIKTNAPYNVISDIFTHYSSQEFIMIESSAYFESYKHVLK
jgi:hypothetical protein